MATPPGFYNLKDQGIYSAGDFFIPQERYRAAPYNVNQPNDPNEVPAGIPTVYQSQGGGGSGGYTGGVNDLIQNYTLDTRDRYFGSQPTPLVDDLYQSKLDKTFFGFPSYKQQQLTGPDLGEYIGSDTDIPLEQTTAGNIQSGLENIKDSASGIMSSIKGFGPISMLLGSMDKFDTLSPADQEFIKQNMGYTGPTVFGENTGGNYVDPFGINTRSAFGNYADYVGEKSTSLGESLSGRLADKYGVEFDEETGMFVGKNADKANQMTKMMRNKYNFYMQKEKERIRNEKLMAEQAAAKAKAESAKQYDPNKHGSTNYGLGSDGQQSYSGDAIGASGLGFGVSATGGGPVSNKTGKGRTGYMGGGLADMLEIYD